MRQTWETRPQGVGVPGFRGGPPSPSPFPLARCAGQQSACKATRVTRGMVGELVTVPQIAAPGSPLFVRLDVLQERYAQLGGDPADLLR